ncbi:MAG: DHH family phosphoesterase [Lachnospiraceae bacterium]|nr:DHH family phosphoesterase [Candidatus Minthocola equi]
MIKGRMRLVKWWPALLIPALIILTIIIFLFNQSAGLAALIFLCLYLIFSIGWFVFWNKYLSRELTRFASAFNKVQKEQLDKIPVPYALLNPDGQIIWNNIAFNEVFSETRTRTEYFPAFFSDSSVQLPARGQWAKYGVSLNEKDYSIEIYNITDEDLYAVTLFDETELNDAYRTIDDQTPAVGQIVIDNYDEVMSSVESVKQALLAALIERRLTRYFSSLGALVYKQEQDKFALVIDKKGIEKARGDRFAILEEVRGINIGNVIAPTLSIGIGMGGADPLEDTEYSRAAVGLCLGRGGDQVIIKAGENTEFFGGKSKETEKKNRVKTRIVAQAFGELLAANDRVLIMGHSNPDVDSLGSAIGIYSIARDLNKQASIVLNAITSPISSLMARLAEEPEFAHVFITGEEALKQLDENTVVVLVDVNRPSFSECPELLEATRTVVVIDHHRQGEETVRSAALEYIEPYASSASEMVAEIIQYFAPEVKIGEAEAEAMYAGIVVDTDNFLTKTGVRTFEAAAYLRRCGTNMTRVRKLFRETMVDFKAKAEVVSSMEIFEDAFAFGECKAEGLDSPTVVCAQAANALLDIEGVKASFVFTPFEGQINMSARSIDEVNVQLICERLGGGGHLSVAGVQFKGCSINDAKELTKVTIKEMIKEGAI